MGEKEEKREGKGRERKEKGKRRGGEGKGEMERGQPLKYFGLEPPWLLAWNGEKIGDH